MQPCTHDFLSLTVPYMNKLHKQKALLLPLFMLWIWTFFYTHACPSSLRVHHDLFLYASIPHFHLILPHGSFSSLVLGLFSLVIFKVFQLDLTLDSREKKQVLSVCSGVGEGGLNGEHVLHWSSCPPDLLCLLTFLFFAVFYSVYTLDFDT